MGFLPLPLGPHPLLLETELVSTDMIPSDAGNNLFFGLLCPPGSFSLKKLVHVVDTVYQIQTVCATNERGLSCHDSSLAQVLKIVPGKRCSAFPENTAVQSSSSQASPLLTLTNSDLRDSSRNQELIFGNCSHLCGVTNMIAKHGCCLSIHEQAHVDWWRAISKGFDFEVMWGTETGREAEVLREPQLQCTNPHVNQAVLPSCFVMNYCDNLNWPPACCANVQCGPGGRTLSEGACECVCTTGYTGAFCDVYRTHTLLELEIAPLELSGFMRGPRIRFATMVVESLSSETEVFPLELFEWDLISASEQGVLVKFRLITSSERDAMRLAQKLNVAFAEEGDLRAILSNLLKKPVVTRLLYAPIAFDANGRELCDDVLYMCPRDVVAREIDVTDSHRVSFSLLFFIKKMEYIPATEEKILKNLAAVSQMPREKIILDKVKFVEVDPTAFRRADPQEAVQVDISILAQNELEAVAVASRVNDIDALNAAFTKSLLPPATMKAAATISALNVKRNIDIVAIVIAATISFLCVSVTCLVNNRTAKRWWKRMEHDYRKRKLRASLSLRESGKANVLRDKQRGISHIRLHLANSNMMSGELVMRDSVIETSASAASQLSSLQTDILQQAKRQYKNSVRFTRGSNDCSNQGNLPSLPPLKTSVASSLVLSSLEFATMPNREKQGGGSGSYKSSIRSADGDRDTHRDDVPGPRAVWRASRELDPEHWTNQLVLDRAIISGQTPIPLLKLQQTARSNMQGPQRDSALGLLKSVGSGGLNSLMQPNVFGVSLDVGAQKLDAGAHDAARLDSSRRTPYKPLQYPSPWRSTGEQAQTVCAPQWPYLPTKKDSERLRSPHVKGPGTHTSPGNEPRRKSSVLQHIHASLLANPFRKQAASLPNTAFSESEMLVFARPRYVSGAEVGALAAVGDVEAGGARAGARPAANGAIAQESVLPIQKD